MAQTDRNKEILKISARNIALNFTLATIKIIAGLISNSLAIMSDGFNSLSDVATTIVVLISNHFTRIPKDKEHQYGHEKIESLATMLIALFLGGVAVFTVYESVQRLTQGGAVEISYFALTVTLISAAVKYFMYRTTASKAKEIDSDALRLVAVDFRFDVFLSSFVFVGVMLAMLGLWYFEPVAAILASVLLLVSASEFFNKSFNQLVDKAADDEVVERITKIIHSCSGVCKIDLIMTRLHGNSIYVDVEISVGADLTVRQGHEIAQQVHDRLELDSDCRIKHCNVHVNPFMNNAD